MILIHTEGLDSGVCSSLDKSKCICFSLKNSILETDVSATVLLESNPNTNLPFKSVKSVDCFFVNKRTRRHGRIRDFDRFVIFGIKQTRLFSS